MHRSAPASRDPWMSPSRAIVTGAVRHYLPALGTEFEKYASPGAWLWLSFTHASPEAVPNTYFLLCAIKWTRPMFILLSSVNAKGRPSSSRHACRNLVLLPIVFSKRRGLIGYFVERYGMTSE